MAGQKVISGKEFCKRNCGTLSKERFYEEYFRILHTSYLRASNESCIEIIKREFMDTFGAEPDHESIAYIYSTAKYFVYDGVVNALLTDGKIDSRYYFTKLAVELGFDCWLIWCIRKNMPFTMNSFFTWIPLEKTKKNEQVVRDFWNYKLPKSMDFERLYHYIYPYENEIIDCYGKLLRANSTNEDDYKSLNRILFFTDYPDDNSEVTDFDEIVISDDSELFVQIPVDMEEFQETEDIMDQNAFDMDEMITTDKKANHKKQTIQEVSPEAESINVTEEEQSVEQNAENIIESDFSPETEETPEPDVEEEMEPDVEEEIEPVVEDTAEQDIDEIVESYVEEVTEPELEKIAESDVEENTHFDFNETAFESETEEVLEQEIEEVYQPVIEEAYQPVIEDTNESDVEEPIEPDVEEIINPGFEETALEPETEEAFEQEIEETYKPETDETSESVIEEEVETDTSNSESELEDEKWSEPEVTTELEVEEVETYESEAAMSLEPEASIEPEESIEPEASIEPEESVEAITDKLAWETEQESIDDIVLESIHNPEEAANDYRDIVPQPAIRVVTKEEKKKMQKPEKKPESAGLHSLIEKLEKPNKKELKTIAKYAAIAGTILVPIILVKLFKKE